MTSPSTLHQQSFHGQFQGMKTIFNPINSSSKDFYLFFSKKSLRNISFSILMMFEMTRTLTHNIFQMKGEI